MGAEVPKKDQRKVQGLESARGARRNTPAWLSLVSPPRAFSRIPTHAVGVAHDRRTHARAALNLPLRLTHVAGRIEPTPLTLLTQNISTTGVLFLSPKHIEPGTPIELEVGLVNRPLGHGSVRMATAARVVRVDTAATPGWHGVAAAFDDIAFDRDEPVPSRYQR
jgi:hypothetical protein